MDPEDSWQQHAADTIAEATTSPTRAVVELLAREAPAAIDDLVRYGAAFAREADGRLSQRYFGAHTYRRTCFAGDYTGLEMQRALVKRATELGVQVLDDLYITRLLVHEGRVFGAYGFDVDDGTRYVILADAVILAAGGHTRIWRRSSSRRDENTGDAMRLAADAGCRLRDMELVQFHPTGMISPEESAGTLVTEAVRGEGGILRNANGERFMERYDPERLELSTRDRIALANYTEIAEGRGTPAGGVLLDISHLDRETILARLPQDVPAVHRSRDARHHPDADGGRADRALLDGRGVGARPRRTRPTSKASTPSASAPRACTARTGSAATHWSSASCSARSWGRRRPVGRRRSTSRSAIARPSPPRRDEVSELLAQRGGQEFPRPLQRAVRDLMSEHAGVVRSENGLTQGLRKLDEVAGRMGAMEVRPDIAGFDDLVHAFDLRGSVLAARATLECALERRETRGAHNRADFPHRDPELAVNLLWRPGEPVAREAVNEPSAEVAALLVGRDEVEVTGRLLE